MKIDVHLDELTRHPDGLAKVTVDVPDLELQRELDLPFADLHRRCGVPDDVTLDLLMVASICYVIDKTVPRKSAFDRWTRTLEVNIPVSSPKKWQKLAGELNRALAFLTGDEWQVTFREAETAFFCEPVQKLRRKRNPQALEIVTAVCLFSGGLDSLIGAIDLLAGDSTASVRLVGHYDAAGPASSQHELFTALEKQYPRRADLLQVRVSHKPLKAKESTLRSRSLLFMALGIFAARAAGEQIPLYASENGLIAINVPLTPSRSGACSTRTMHPFFLDKLRTVLSGIGISNQIINPFELKTKGECVAQCLNRQLLDGLVETSVSCSHPTRKQHWQRRSKEVRNCGYCVPCLIRRAALHKAGLDAAQKYGIDVCEEELNYDDDLESADDFRAVLDMLNHHKTAAEFKQDILSVASVSLLNERAEMVARGFDEIRLLVQHKGSKSILKAANAVNAG